MSEEIKFATVDHYDNAVKAEIMGFLEHLEYDNIVLYNKSLSKEILKHEIHDKLDEFISMGSG